MCVLVSDLYILETNFTVSNLKICDLYIWAKFLGLSSFKDIRTQFLNH